MLGALFHQDRDGAGRVSDKIKLRHFLARSENFDGGQVTITGPEARHIHTVLRLRAGDRIVVVDEAGQKFLSSIRQNNGEKVTADIVEQLAADSSRKLTITLAQAIPKNRKMDDIVRMVCELGVGRIIPVITERGVVRPDEGSTKQKLARWRSIAESAAKQSRSGAPADITGPVTVEQLAQDASCDLRVVLWAGAGCSLKTVLNDNRTPESLLLFVGPEGGLVAEKEIGLLASAGFRTASIGDNILRTETAGIVAVSAIVYHYNG